MEKAILFTSYKLGNLVLKNRIVMAPMTRCRATDNIPNDLMAEYYEQRSGAGLIITEGTSPSPNGVGYARIPGIYSKSQIEGWKKATEAVHKNGSKIFLQMMHTGRIAHHLNMPLGGQILAPSPLKASGKMYTDQKGEQEYPTPKAMSKEDITMTKAEFVQAAKNAIEAGFDGVEIHAANGYLLEQFINPVTNIREDEYGGSIPNRSRFVVEVVNEVASAIGKDKVGIRLSPYGTLNDMSPYEATEMTYHYLAQQMNNIGIVYVHIVDHSSMGAPEVNQSIKERIRSRFDGTYILSGGYDHSSAETDLRLGKGDLVAFGKTFAANPDLVDRLKYNYPLNNELRTDLFYTEGPEGYVDYATISTEKAAA